MKLYWYYIAISLGLEALAENNSVTEITENKPSKSDDTVLEKA